MAGLRWRPLPEHPIGPSEPGRAWLVPCRAMRTNPTPHRHMCTRVGDLGHYFHECACYYEWRQESPGCCFGTGFADYAAVPCPAPTCPVPTDGEVR